MHSLYELIPKLFNEGVFLGERFRLSPANRFNSLTAPMAKTLAIIFGVIFVLVGLLGFVPNPLVGANALFDTNTVHDLVHLVIGIVLLIVAFYASEQSALWLKIVGIVYLLVALLGFFTASPLFGLVEVNDADNWLHIVLGIVLIAAGYWGKDSHPMMGASTALPIQKPTM